jgi:hypothetical protein
VTVRQVPAVDRGRGGEAAKHQAKAQQNNSKPSLPINKTPRKPLTFAFL